MTPAAACSPALALNAWGPGAGSGDQHRRQPRAQEAVPFVLGSLGRLLDHPGVYVWGANDYYPPTFKNPCAT